LATAVFPRILGLVYYVHVHGSMHYSSLTLSSLSFCFGDNVNLKNCMFALGIVLDKRKTTV